MRNYCLIYLLLYYKLILKCAQCLWKYMSPITVTKLEILGMMENGIILRNLLKGLADLFFSRRCRLCSIVFNQGPSNWICNDCLGQIISFNESVCKTCGKPLYLDYQTSDYCCGDCLGDPPPYDILRSFGRYEGGLRKMIHHFKYNRLPGLADDLSGFLIDVMKNAHFPNDFDRVFYVPVHRNKLIERGFDPTFLLAGNIAAEFDVPLSTNTLRKVKETVPQVSLSRKDRLKNVTGTFSFESTNLIEGKKVLLVDDVYTTGATMKECSTVLKSSGAEKVFCLTLARA